MRSRIYLSAIFLFTVLIAQPSFIENNIYSNSSNKPAAISFTDLDRDGDIDIISVLADNNGDKILVWNENNGSESFTQNTLISTHTFISERNNSISSADLDNDGDIDIVGAASNSVRIYWNNGSQTFTEQS